MLKIPKDLYLDGNKFMTDAYDRLAAKLSVMKNNGGNSLFTMTGCEPGVGTTATAISTAVSLAMAKHSVLLVDADMRKPSSQKRLNQNVRYGLSDFLTDDIDFQDATGHTNFEYLDYMSCGNKLDNPVMLINSAVFDEFLDYLKSSYDYVVFDTPSLNATVDAGVIASKTSGVVLVAGYLQTRTSQINAAKKELVQLNANILGIILNNIPKSKYKRFVGFYDYFEANQSKKPKQQR